MKNINFGKIIIEGVVGIVLTGAVELISHKLTERKKKEDMDNVMVSDLTVGELREILRDEA